MFGRAPPVSKRIFDKHDQDKSGYICAGEFKALCYELGHYFTDEGLLKYFVFILLMTKLLSKINRNQRRC